MGPDSAVAGTFDSGMLPNQLAGSEVRFDGLAAPLFYVQSSQMAVLQLSSGGTREARCRRRIRLQSGTAQR
ncbi:MAG: hypothetical protein LAQ69_11560 [Acidobacteriia bacterium]|nr:hypothetical protein [Terriglobia bacterium]